MLFNSYEFIFLFLPLAFLGYFWLNKKRLTNASKAYLVFASLFFYSWWNIMYLPLILASVLFNYVIGTGMLRAKAKCAEGNKKIVSAKTLLIIGITANVSLLGYFKYMDFFIFNTNAVFGTDYAFMHIALPLAISFFTLQQIAYLVDSYEGLAKENDFLNYSLFVVFFPQLIAGPIVHHKEMMPQFEGLRSKIFNHKNIAAGLFIFSVGLFKKVFIADTFAIWATNGFDHAQVLTFFEAWATSLSYTFQLYFDFSGYTDMALGAALLFNIRLPQNFNSPYKSKGIIEFWQRWHITLTNFLTTYLYTPILRSYKKITFEKAMFATFITMFIAGLWHGAGWTFIIFGSLHGAGIIVNHYWRKTKIKLHHIAAWFITFNFVNIGFVFFRATDIESAGKVLSGMVGLNGVVLPTFLASKLAFLENFGIEFGGFVEHIQGTNFTPLWLVFGFVLVLFMKNSSTMIKTKYNTLDLLFLLSISVISIGYIDEYNEFLYFNF